MSLQHIPGQVPATFSCVWKCCDFVPATCPCYTSLLHVASVYACVLNKFLSLQHVAATCFCNMTPRVYPPSSFSVAVFGFWACIWSFTWFRTHWFRELVFAEGKKSFYWRSGPFWLWERECCLLHRLSLEIERELMGRLKTSSKLERGHLGTSAKRERGMMGSRKIGTRESLLFLSPPHPGFPRAPPF